MTLGTWYSYGRILQDPALWDFAYAQYRNTTYGGPLGPSQPGLWDANYSLFYRDQARGQWRASTLLQNLQLQPVCADLY